LRAPPSTEMLQAVRVLKLYAWEEFFLAQVTEVRQHELLALRKQNVLRALNTFSIVGIPLLVGLATFSLYAGLGNSTRPEVAFPSLALLNSLIFPLTYLPMSVTAAINALLALRRIQAFLLVRLRASPPQKTS
jgi:ATP-binding cassette subfamily C (CFTR/MRP) protein 1